MFRGETKLPFKSISVTKTPQERRFESFFLFFVFAFSQVMNEELYDTIQISRKDKPVATVRAVKDVRKQQSNLPPTRPPKSNRAPEVSALRTFQTVDVSHVLK